MENVSIQLSNGRTKYGIRFAFIRPSKECFNRSRRVAVEKIEETISKHFPVVNYYLIDGSVIGAKNEQFALKEYWRVCPKEKMGKLFDVQIID